MASFYLKIANSAQDGLLDVALSLNGQNPKEDTIQKSAFADLDAICAKLNDRNDRNQAAAIGRDLFKRVFVPGRALHNYWYQLPDLERRIPMDLAMDAVEVSPYPWELMRDADDIIPAVAGGLFRRSRSKGTSLSLAWPLRFLVILGTKDPNIRAESEIDTLKQELADLGRSIDVWLLSLPTLSEIQNALKVFKPNIIHFIGHSVAGGLLVAGKTENWTWATTNIANDLADPKWSPALVFLNSCRSASLSGPGDIRRWTGSLQERFAQRAACVIAMQADVPGELALKFSHEFYRRAFKQLDGHPCSCVSQAVKDARNAITPDLDSLDWALPSLMVQREMDSEFVIRRERVWPATPEFSACKEFEETRLFANCGEERRRLVDWLLPIDPPRREQNVLILHAAEGSGRSHLVKWCTETWAAQDGFTVCYRDAGSLDGMNSFKLLVLIRTEPQMPARTSDQLLHQSLTVDPFRPFYAEAAKAIGLTATASDQLIQIIDAEPHRLTSAKDLELICGKFLSGLKQLGGKRIIVLDQLDRINSALTTEFRDHILLKLASDESSDVRLVLVMNETHYQEWGLEAIGHPGIRDVRLSANQTPEDLLKLALEACRLGPLSIGREQRKKELIAQFVKESLEEPDGAVGLGRLNFLPEIKKIFRLNPARMR